jgi:hypothetical protein
MLFVLFSARLNISRASDQEFGVDSAKNGHATLHRTSSDRWSLRILRRLTSFREKAQAKKLAQKEREQDSAEISAHAPEPRTR